ncbi:MAG TPA: signal peptidase II [Spirochaetia bacterium]|nr:signal peptidase II [Spirochaetales bacterium]HOT59166.1 signal peptidase II [Spirochaetales bacterium]HPD79812.1 signal peptidase II [Spirochaetales bacterium]HQK34008.1 signal peptidase II [Spirochaetales bacterium]HRS65929.1 signal peptidase II [Spirochaetia bacterium]
MSTSQSKQWKPLLFTASIVLIDQIVKLIITSLIKLNTIAVSWLGDFLWITHQRNSGGAFSFADSASPIIRILIFILIPLAVLALLAWSILFSKEYKPLERWMLAGIIGGGLGNIVDRIFRPQGVVDFISIKFYGLFGFERWPTFNIADSCIVVCGIILCCSLIFSNKNNRETE